MEATTIQNRSKLIAGIISLAITTALIFMLVLFKVVSKPIEANIFELSDQSKEFGISIYSNNEIAQNELPRTSQKANEIAPLSTPQNKPTLFENGAPLLANYLKSNNINTSSSNSFESTDGIPDSKPFGNNTNVSNKDNTSPENNYSLESRKLFSMCEIKDSKEEGIVVVKIRVNKAGQVIDADPNERGTNTSSSVLKEKARKAALCAVFSPSDKYDEQVGSITLKFEF